MPEAAGLECLASHPRNYASESLMFTRTSPLVVIVGLCFFATLAAPAFAQEKQGKRDFKAFDVNNDGRISPAEWKQKAQSRSLSEKQTVERFHAIDTDKDGFISGDEMGAWTQKKPKAKKKAQAEAGKDAQSADAQKADKAAKSKAAKKAKKAKQAK
jgi:Ca2+-binding EF-hand superfamily protein